MLPAVELRKASSSPSSTKKSSSSQFSISGSRSAGCRGINRRGSMAAEGYRGAVGGRIEAGYSPHEFVATVSRIAVVRILAISRRDRPGKADQ